MTHKIAIIKTREFTDYSDYDGYSIMKIAESITDWQEVSDEDFQVLQYALPKTGHIMIERPLDEGKFIAKTIAEHIAYAQEQARIAAEEKKKREDAALQRKIKKELKDTKTKQALYQALRAEFEGKEK